MGDGMQARPPDLLRELLDPKFPPRLGEKDVCNLRGNAVGESGGREMAAVVDIFDYYDEATGFTAMERTTGWHAAILAILAARGEIAKDAIPVERASSGKRVLEKCRARGMKIHLTLSAV